MRCDIRLLKQFDIMQSEYKIQQYEKLVKQ